MEHGRGILAVVMLLIIVVLAISSAWRGDPDAGEESGRSPEAQEEFIRKKLDDWTPLAP